MSFSTVRSADGSTIAYEAFGEGPVVMTVCGATCERGLMRPTAQALGEHLTAINYDRRGRGDSTDTAPYAVAREIEDLAALIDVLGAPVHLYGHSSGAGLVARAVSAGLPVERFVLHDPPYSPADATSQADARAYGHRIAQLVASDDRVGALETFMQLTGMPEEVIDGVRSSPMWPAMLALAHTLLYDSTVMDDIETGGAVPAALLAQATQPAMVLVGEQSPRS